MAQIDNQRLRAALIAAGMDPTPPLSEVVYMAELVSELFDAVRKAERPLTHTDSGQKKWWQPSRRRLRRARLDAVQQYLVENGTPSEGTAEWWLKVLVEYGF